MWVAAKFTAIMAVIAFAASTSEASPTPGTKEGLDKEDQLRLLWLPYGRLASRFWDFIKVKEDIFQTKTYYSPSTL